MQANEIDMDRLMFDPRTGVKHKRKMEEGRDFAARTSIASTDDPGRAVIDP